MLSWSYARYQVTIHALLCAHCILHSFSNNCMHCQVSDQHTLSFTILCFCRLIQWYYDHALKKHGSVSVKVKRSIIVGPLEVGKSSLKRLLVHDTPKAVKESTGVMDTPEVVSVSSEQYAVEDGSSAWQMVNSDIMRKSLHRA